ncbi:MAG: hypothetical protein ACRC0G_07250 [Fusobacteriaceae bacterium]
MNHGEIVEFVYNRDGVEQVLNFNITPVIDYLDIITELEGRQSHGILKHKLKYDNQMTNLLIANGINRNCSTAHEGALSICKNLSTATEEMAKDAFNLYTSGEDAEHEVLLVISAMINLLNIANAIMSVSPNIITGKDSEQLISSIEDMVTDIGVFYSEMGILLEGVRSETIENIKNNIKFENMGAIIKIFSKLRDLLSTDINPVFHHMYTEGEDGNIVKVLVDDILIPGQKVLWDLYCSY